MYSFMTKSLKPTKSLYGNIFSRPSEVFSFIEVNYNESPHILNQAYALARDNFDAIDILEAIPTFEQDANTFRDNGYIFRGFSYNRLEDISKFHGYKFKSIAKAAKRAGLNSGKEQRRDANKVIHHSRSPACLIYEIEQNISLSERKLFYKIINGDAPINTLHARLFPEKIQHSGPGRISQQHLDRYPEKKLIPARIYLVHLNESGENIYKIGITANEIKKRLTGWNHNIVLDIKSNLQKAFSKEQSVLKKYEENRIYTDEFSHRDGYTEIMQLSSNEVSDVINMINEISH